MRRLSSGAILNFAPLRWIASIDPTLPHEVRKRLGDMFFSSTKPFFLGAANSTAVLSVAFCRIGDPVFLVIVALEVMLLVARLSAIRTAERSTTPFFVVRLAWALTQAFTISLIVLSRDIPMTIIVLASSLAAIGSIIGRNFAAPRYAMKQVLLIDISFKASFSFLYPEFLPLILCQTVLFFLMNLTMIEQQAERHRACDHRRARKPDAILSRSSHGAPQSPRHGTRIRKPDRGWRSALASLSRSRQLQAGERWARTSCWRFTVGRG